MRFKLLEHAFPQAPYCALVFIIVCTILRHFISTKTKQTNKKTNSQTHRFPDSRKTAYITYRASERERERERERNVLYSRLSVGSKEMDVLRDAMAKRFREQVTGGQRNEERRVENRSGVVSGLDPEPLSQSSFVNHRHDWSHSDSDSDSSYHRRRRRIGDRSDGFAAISQRFKKKKEKMALLTDWARSHTRTLF